MYLLYLVSCIIPPTKPLKFFVWWWRGCVALLGKGRNHRFDFLAKNQYMNNSLIFLVYHTTIFAVIFAGVMSIAFSRTWALMSYMHTKHICWEEGWSLLFLLADILIYSYINKISGLFSICINKIGIIMDPWYTWSVCAREFLVVRLLRELVALCILRSL